MRTETDYYSFSDAELVSMAQEGNMEAEETLIRKYKGIVKTKANMYYMAGADDDDIVQEGMIGLFKAIRQFDISKQAAFGTFAGICITRQIISAIRSADRDKHKALNTSVSLSNPVEQDSETIRLEDTLRTDMAENPETLLVIKDVVDYILTNGDNIFSDLEKQVLDEVLQGRCYEKIAVKLGKNVKSVDNAMQRARKKIIGYLWR